jgi:integrase
MTKNNSRINLTPGRIREFCTDKPQSFLWDAKAPGLAVRATASGNKSFIFQGKLSGNTIRCTIGDVNTWKIDNKDRDDPGARQEACRLQTLIDKGIDPREEKAERMAAAEAKREEARRKDVTVSEAWGDYIAARRAKWSPRHLADHENTARAGGEDRKRGPGKIEPGPLAVLMSIRLSDLTPERVASWLDDETVRRPTYAALAYRLLRAFLRWCASRAEYRTAVNLEAVGSRVAKDHLPRPKAKEGDSLQREQLPPWFAAVRQIGNPVISAYLQGLLLTGARREELAGLTWADVDFQWKSLTIRDKVEGERIIPLTPYLAALLYALPRRKGADGKPTPWVFSSPTAASGRIQEPRIAHLHALKAAGLPHLSLHGLRRSFGTLAEWVECPTGVVAQIMGHKPSAIAEKHYHRRPLDLLRMWHVRIEAFMLEQAGIPQPAEDAEGLRLVKGKTAT